MDVFVHRKCAAIQGQLTKLYRIHKYLTVTARKSSIQALVISCLYYCCSLLLGTKKANIDSVTTESKYGNRVPKTKIRRKPDSFKLVYTKL